MQHAALATRLLEVLAGQGDADALFTLLEQELSRSPQDPQLYGLRAQLNDASGYRGPAWHDLQQAAALAPADREAALALVAYQCRHASRLAWCLSEDEEDEDAIEAHGTELDAQAVASLWRLMRDYAGDAAFALRLSSVLEENHVWRPWDRYGLVLTALAANPGDWALRKKEALVFAWLASVGPDPDDIDVIPAGYYADWHGNQLHALGTERALAAIGLLLLERTDAELLTEQASLLTTLERVGEAAVIHARLITLYEEQLLHAAPAERDDLLQRLERAREDHANCATGRSAYLDSQEATLASAISELVKLTGGGKRVEGLRADAQAWRNDAEAVQRGPDQKQKAELDTAAKVVAGQTVALLSEPSVSLRSQASEDIAGEISPWFAELAPGLQLTGLSMATGFENPNYAGRFGWHQGQLWAHPDGRLALIAECVPRIRLARAMSRLSDGTILLTAASLGTSMFSAGPRVDMFCVLPDTPVNEMVALHSARLARRLAAEPALSALPIRNVPQLVQAENDMLALKNAFRRSVGLTDYEIRGMHVQHHDYFAQVVKAEVAALLAAGA